MEAARNLPNGWMNKKAKHDIKNILWMDVAEYLPKGWMNKNAKSLTNWLICKQVVWYREYGRGSIV